jgi:hypothetical protein
MPDVDLRVVLLGSRHGGKLALIQDLVAAAQDPTRGNTLAGALNVPLRQVPAAYKREAIELQSLDVAVAAASDHAVIDQLEEQVASWYAMHFPSPPGMSITRERWEERYLDDKAPLWRKGIPARFARSAMRAPIACAGTCT